MNGIRSADRLLRGAALAGALLLLAACSRVTADNYNKLEAGMSRDEVYAILGKPDQVEGSGLGTLTISSETWRGGGQRIELSFIGDQLATKSLRSEDPADAAERN
jgi:hypothetical protein